MIAGQGFQAHSTVVLLPAWESQACRWQEFWGRIAGSEEPSLWAAGVLGPDCCMGFREHSTVVLLPAQGTKSAGLHLLLPTEQQNHGSCLPRGASFQGVSG
jgi:hypothetical protein